MNVTLTCISTYLRLFYYGQQKEEVVSRVPKSLERVIDVSRVYAVSFALNVTPRLTGKIDFTIDMLPKHCISLSLPPCLQSNHWYFLQFSSWRRSASSCIPTLLLSSCKDVERSRCGVQSSRVALAYFLMVVKLKGLIQFHNLPRRG